MRTRVLVVMFTLLLVLPVTFTAADQVEETTTIASGEPVVVPMNLKPSSKVNYTVRVTSGPNVNTFFMSQPQFSSYASGDRFGYDQNYSRLDSSYAKRVGSWDTEGRYYLVIETVSEAGPDQVSNVSYSVPWRKGKDTENGSCWPVVCFVILFVGVFAIFRLLQYKDDWDRIRRVIPGLPGIRQMARIIRKEATPDQGPEPVPPGVPPHLENVLVQVRTSDGTMKRGMVTRREHGTVTVKFADDTVGQFDESDCEKVS